MTEWMVGIAFEALRIVGVWKRIFENRQSCIGCNFFVKCPFLIVLSSYESLDIDLSESFRIFKKYSLSSEIELLKVGRIAEISQIPRKFYLIFKDFGQKVNQFWVICCRFLGSECTLLGLSGRSNFTKIFDLWLIVYFFSSVRLWSFWARLKLETQSFLNLFEFKKNQWCRR